MTCVFQAGDRVFSTGSVTGGYAEYTVASEDTVHKLPDLLDFKQGAAVGIPYFTAYRALFHKYDIKFAAFFYTCYFMHTVHAFTVRKATNI